MNCGTQLNWPVQQQTQYQPNFQQPYGHQQQANNQNTRTSPWLILFIAVIILGVLGGASYLAYDSFLKEPQPPAPTTPTEPPVPETPPPVDDQPPVDTTPPIISDIEVSQTEESMVVTWITNEPATDQVEYGESDDYNFTTALNDNLATSHSVTIDNLTPGTLYHLRVKSRDNTGNEAISEDNTVTMLQPALKREAKIVSDLLDWEGSGNVIFGVVRNTGDVDIEARDIKILIEYESYIVEDQTFEKLGSVNSEPAVIEPGKYTEFSISLEVINVKPDYKISLKLLGE